MDSETEQSVQEALRALSSDGRRTVLIVAHRLSTVQNADVIVVLERGVVVEQGTHAELLRREGGRYAELVMNMQQS